MTASASQRVARRESLAVAGAVSVYGASFGAVSVASGLDVWQTCALSALMFTGASQFAFVGVLAGGGGPWSASLTAGLLGLRNTLYGLRLAALLQVPRRRRPLWAHLVIDESTAMAITRDTTRQARLGFFWTGASIFLLWNFSTLLGALAGSAIGDPRDYGLDAAVGAAFLGLLWPQLHTWGARFVALLAAAVALGLVPWSPAGVPIIVGGAVAVLVGLWRHVRPPEELL